MPEKQYYVPDMPEDESHTGFHGFLDRIRGIAGVHNVTVDRENKNVTVHVHDEGYIPHVDQVVMEYGQLPGFTGQV